MRKIKLIVEYDGTDFAGLQTQVSGTRTVQSVLDAAIAKITGEQVTIHAAGRTDSGVHALGQVVHFRTESTMTAPRLESALNAVLARDVGVRSVCDVDDMFHARFSATRRTYLYGIVNRPARSPLWDRYTLHEPKPLDVGAMRSAAERLRGTHDFGAFANSGGNPGSTLVRRIERLDIRRARGGEQLIIVVSANAFLRSMVRNLVGALLAVGRGAITTLEIDEILASRDRMQNPCHTAAARGLCLYRVDYDEDFSANVEKPGPKMDEVDDEEG